jgi:hypothetical protein
MDTRYGRSKRIAALEDRPLPADEPAVAERQARLLEILANDPIHQEAMSARDTFNSSWEFLSDPSGRALAKTIAGSLAKANKRLEKEGLDGQ